MPKSKSRTVARLPHQQTERDTAAIEAVAVKASGRPTPPLLKMNFDKATRTNTVSFEHDDQTTAQALTMFDMGTADTRFYHGLTCQISLLGEHGQAASETASNFALSVIRGVNP